MKKKLILTCLAVVLALLTKAQTYQWKNVRIGGCGAVTSIQAHPKVQNLYFMTTDVGNPYRWNETSQSWEPLLNAVTLSNFNTGACENLAFDPSDATGNVLYATVGKYYDYGNTGKVIKSIDRGNTWVDCNLTIWVGANDDQQSGQRIAVDPQNSNVVWVTTHQDGTYKSVNAGTSWTKVNTTNGEFLTFDANSGTTGGVTKTIYIATATGISRSTDGGATFANMSGSPASTHRSSIHSDGTMYVSGDNGLYKWNGTAWSTISPVSGNRYGAIAVNPNNSSQVITAYLDWTTEGAPTYLSNNGGTSWTTMNNTNDFSEIPFQPAFLFASTIYPFCWDPFTAGKVWFGDYYNAFLTTNVTASTVTWKARAIGHEEVVTTGSLVAPPSGVNVLLSCTADVGGFDHASITAPPSNSLTNQLAYINCSGVAFQETNTNFIARVGSNGWGGAAIGGYSLNGGNTYTAFSSLPGNRGRIAISASSQTMLWATQGGYTYRSTNLGGTWTKVASIPTSVMGGGNLFFYGNPIAADKVNGNKFYIYNAGKMYVSTDGGVTFTVGASNLPSVTSDLIFKVETTPGIDGDLWMSFDGGGLYHSTNSGTSFTQVTNVQSARLFSVGKALSGTPAIYVFGTVNNIADGVFRSDNNGVSWTQINTTAYRMGMEPNSMAADRITYGRVYIGTNGNGIYVGDAGTAVAVTGVTVSPSSTSVAASSTTQLTATVAPSNATNQTVTWTTSNSAAATVSSTGLVTGVAAGSATITATTQDGGFTATSTITVTASTSTNIAPSGTAYTFSKNTTATSNSNKVAAAGLNDGNATTDVYLNGHGDDNSNAYESAGVTWATAQNNINKVEFVNGTYTGGSDNGSFSSNLVLQSSTDGTSWTNVTGWTLTPTYAYETAAVGGATFTFTGASLNGIKGMRITGQVHISATTGSWEAYIRELSVWTSTATVHVTGVSVSPATANIVIGATTQLAATVAPSNATNQTVTWTTSNSAIGIVSASGLVTGVAAGSATITATTQDGSFTATSTITVTSPANIATSGTAYSFSKNTTATSNSNKVAAAGLNDGNTTTDIYLNGNGDDAANAYESAGITWTTAQNNIYKVEFVNGTYAGGNNNGCFSGGLVLQSSTDGTIWTNVTGWTLTPTYSYDQASVGGATFSFTGTSLSGIKGIRITGQVHLASTNDSWEAYIRELRVWNTGGSGSMAVVLNSSSKILDTKSYADSVAAIQQVMVYPNPAHIGNTVTVSASNFKNTYNVNIYNMDGRLVYTKTNIAGNLTIDPQELKTRGLFVVIVNEGNKFFTKKLIIR